MKSKNLITVVTDTQYTADSIAKAIGATQQHENYYLGNGYAVVWTNGEIIEATFQPEKSLVLSTRIVNTHSKVGRPLIEKWATRESMQI